MLVATLGHRPDDDRIYYKEIVTLLGAGHEVTLVTRNQAPFNPGEQGFRHVDIASGRFGKFGRGLLDLAASWRPQIVMIHEFELLPSGARIRKRWGTPLVYDVHEPNPQLWDLASTKPRWATRLVNGALDRFERRYLRQVDHVLSTSPFISPRYSERGLPTTLVPNFPRLPAPAPAGEREPLVVYQGQVSFQRGLPQLIQAFASVLREHPTARLELIGPPDMPGTAAKLRAILEERGLQQNAALRDRIPHPAVLERLMQATVGVVPFIDHPLFRAAVPIKLFEYMLCGCAVVASDLPVIRHFAHDAALLVPPGDVAALTQAISSLLGDAERRESLAARGRKLVDTTCNWQQVEPTLLATLDSLA
ncbi:MAG: glycosyltransferase family 4 protein [Candidatus Neomarinimicrobiota bacterium]